MCCLSRHFMMKFLISVLVFSIVMHQNLAFVLKSVRPIEDISCSFQDSMCSWYSKGGTKGSNVRWRLANTTTDPDVPGEKGNGFLVLRNTEDKSRSRMDILWSPAFTWSLPRVTLSLMLYCCEDTELEIHLLDHDDENHVHAHFGAIECIVNKAWNNISISLDHYLDNEYTQQFQVTLYGVVKSSPLAVKNLVFISEKPNITSSTQVTISKEVSDGLYSTDKNATSFTIFTESFSSESSSSLSTAMERNSTSNNSYSATHSDLDESTISFSSTVDAKKNLSTLFSTPSPVATRTTVDINGSSTQFPVSSVTSSLSEKTNVSSSVTEPFTRISESSSTTKSTATFETKNSTPPPASSSTEVLSRTETTLTESTNEFSTDIGSSRIFNQSSRIVTTNPSTLHTTTVPVEKYSTTVGDSTSAQTFLSTSSTNPSVSVSTKAVKETTYTMTASKSSEYARDSTSTSTSISSTTYSVADFTPFLTSSTESTTKTSVEITKQLKTSPFTTPAASATNEPTVTTCSPQSTFTPDGGADGVPGIGTWELTILMSIISTLIFAAFILLIRSRSFKRGKKYVVNRPPSTSSKSKQKSAEELEMRVK